MPPFPLPGRRRPVHSPPHLSLVHAPPLQQRPNLLHAHSNPHSDFSVLSGPSQPLLSYPEPMEVSPRLRFRIGNPGRMDLYVHNTCMKFKTNIVRNNTPIPGYVAQLDGYLESLLKAGTGVRTGILTDGVHYFLRRVGEEKLPLQRRSVLHIFDRAEQAPRVRQQAARTNCRLSPTTRHWP